MTARETELLAARARVHARLEAIVGEGPAYRAKRGLQDPSSDLGAGREVRERELARFDEALTHPSYANESSEPDNQRLEFLGDAVLGLCVSEILARERPDADEGALTRMRSALVNAEALAMWARAEGIGEAIALGKGARAGSEREQTNVLADAVEALVACVYEARGIEGARSLVEHVIREPMQEAARLGSRDPKSLLQEQVQARGLAAPTYRVRGMRGPQHDPTFEVEVIIDDAVAGVGEGRSKRVAERAAATSALTTTQTESSNNGEPAEAGASPLAGGGATSSESSPPVPELTEEG